jgi:DNA-binding XRE family transcriptional regulator
VASAIELAVAAPSGPGEGRQPRLGAGPGREIICRRFGEAMRRLRLEAGLSMDALGERCGLHRTEIRLLEKAAREPKLSTIVKVADGLGVTLG